MYYMRRVDEVNHKGNSAHRVFLITGDVVCTAEPSGGLCRVVPVKDIQQVLFSPTGTLALRVPGRAQSDVLLLLPQRDAVGELLKIVEILTTVYTDQASSPPPSSWVVELPPGPHKRKGGEIDPPLCMKRPHDVLPDALTMDIVQTEDIAREQKPIPAHCRRSYLRDMSSESRADSPVA
eukprot:TRINITY_DN18069_c1_g1_i1.p2 TRINITY_DN18069_c1_g1~~TRINITY_DN18069_c1_g1_i1.p2  ORF type:complete len:179 (+),score=17.23 TRINITY_DN18069_c1_g1_i1:440-976(+)